MACIAGHISTMRALTPAPLRRRSRPLRSIRIAFPASRPQPRYAARQHIQSPRVADRPCGQTSPSMGRLVTASRRTGFVILRAAGSPPAAPHPASCICAVGRRSCLRLHVWWLHMAQTPTMLTNRT